MIVDSHCHVWDYWPYTPEVPDPKTRGTVEMLIDQMNLNGVDRATIVSASITHNPNNNLYVSESVRRYSDRLEQFADVDSSWSDTYHTPGAAKRLEKIMSTVPAKGFTHYLSYSDNAEWFVTREGLDFFKVADELNLIASIACFPKHQPMIRKIAQRYPDLTILCHHMSGLRAFGDDVHTNLETTLESAKLPNIYLKFSGFHYVTNQEKRWDYPYKGTTWIYESCYSAFKNRMVWGSDYPVVTSSMTYRQSLESFRSHCSFITSSDRKSILRPPLNKLLAKARVVEK